MRYVSLIIPIFISISAVIYNFVISYSELQARVSGHIELTGKKDAVIEKKLDSMDNKLNIILLSRSQLNEKLEKIINDTRGEKRR